NKRQIIMLATHLPKAKTDKLSANQIVLKPNWVLDCIKEGKRLSYDSYRLLQPGRNSANDPNFVQNFYKSSRLHHLSTWREDLKQYARQLMTNKESVDIFAGPNYIFHVDMDCFFASVSARDKPEL